MLRHLHSDLVVFAPFECRPSLRVGISVAVSVSGGEGVIIGGWGNICAQDCINHIRGRRGSDGNQLPTSALWHRHKLSWKL